MKKRDKKLSLHRENLAAHRAADRLGRRLLRDDIQQPQRILDHRPVLQEMAVDDIADRRNVLAAPLVRTLALALGKVVADLDLLG